MHPYFCKWKDFIIFPMAELIVHVYIYTKLSLWFMGLSPTWEPKYENSIIDIIDFHKENDFFKKGNIQANNNQQCPNLLIKVLI